MLATTAPGCALVDLFDGDPVALVRFFGAHAGTPNEDGYPDYGDEQTTRVFVTDTGWLISLHDVYVTTSEIHLVRCEASSGTSIEMFWGPCPESFVSINDLESIAIGGVTVNDGLYCGVDVTYGPFIPPEDGDDHISVGNPMIRDNTVVVIGVARRGEPPNEEVIPFEVISSEIVYAHADISRLEAGGPMRLEDEDFPRDLTLIKTYDHFFDGIDFSTASPAEIEAAVLGALERDIIAHDGTYD